MFIYLTFTLSFDDAVLESSAYQTLFQQFQGSKFYNLNNSDFLIPRSVNRVGMTLTDSSGNNIGSKVVVYDNDVYVQSGLISNIGVVNFSFDFSVAGEHELKFYIGNNLIMSLMLSVREFAIFLYGTAGVFYQLSQSYNSAYADRVLATATSLNIIGNLLQIAKNAHWTLSQYKAILYAVLWNRFYVNKIEGVEKDIEAVTGVQPYIESYRNSPFRMICGYSLIDMSKVVVLDKSGV
jgi:hypothetical protein